MFGWQSLAEILFCFMQVLFLSENYELCVLSLGARHNSPDFNQREKLNPNFTAVFLPQYVLFLK